MDTSQLYSTTSSGPAMGDPNQGSSSSSSGRRRSREIETLALEIRKYPRDLLHSSSSPDLNTIQHHHSGQQPMRSAMEEQGQDGDIELNLGLSLGGRFGVDKSHRGLVRASSIAGTIPLIREEESVAPPPANVTAVARTSSLPSETEEEWRRRKELQTLRRMEAKRRKSEKQRITKENSVGGGAPEERESGLNLNFRGSLDREQQHLGLPGKLNPGIGLPGHWAASSRQEGIGSVMSGGFEAVGLKGKGGFFGSLQGLLGQQQQQQQLQQQLQLQQEGCSQGFAESQRGSSSGVSEFESKTHQGSGPSGRSGEARSPASIQSIMQERGSHENAMGSSSHTKYGEGSSKQPNTSDHQKKEAGASRIEDMPSVFTVGEGPNGRKVEGILYEYGRGEEVRIMCICHGNFFSPAEFVKHAGGRDVEHPMRHILINPPSPPFE